MTHEAKTIYTVLGIAGIIGYIAVLNHKIKSISSIVDTSIDNLASNIEIQVSDKMLNLAVEKAVSREVGYISKQIARESEMEIRTHVKYAVDSASRSVKEDVTKEITNQVKHISISDIEKEVIDRAKDAVAEKFDTKLEGILSDFNDNLNNIQKIYSSIAKSIAKD